MKKRFLLSIIAILAGIATSFGQTWNIGYPNEEDVTATFIDGTLTISGIGAMKDYPCDGEGKGIPWYNIRESIHSVVIQSGVTHIGNGAFSSCNITSVSLPNTVTTIGDCAFAYSWEMIPMSINISNSVVSIGEYAFSGAGLTSIDLPESIVNIGQNAFGQCYNLTEINVNEANTRYSSSQGVLYNKSQDTLIQYPGGKAGAYMIPESVLVISNNAFAQCQLLTSITIPDNVNNIGESAFSGCFQITSITLPAGITTIGRAAFFQCINLKEINVSESNLHYSSVDGILYDKAKSRLIACPGGISRETGKFIVPDNVTTIEEYACLDNYNIKQLVLPASLSKIEHLAFNNCHNITSVSISNPVPPVIDDLAFLYVDLSLVTLYVPAASLTAYQSAPVWKDFGTIVELGTIVEQSSIYNPDDIAVINAIVDNNGLNWTKADPADGSYVPADWTGVSWSGEAKNNRVISLDISEHALTGVLDLSGLTNLRLLHCNNNNLTLLEVSKLTNLEGLYCDHNSLTSLDVLKLTNLLQLECWNNNLTSLNVSKLTNLQTLSCSGNNLASLDVSNLINLWYLSCESSNLTSLEVSKLTNLQYFSCPDNNLTSLDVSNLINLQYLSCFNNNIASLDVSKLTNLQYLSCFNNNIASLDVSKLTNLQTLYCYSNYLTSLDVSKLTNLQHLVCYNNNIASLDVSKLTNLQTLYCYSNYLTSLDVSKLTNLQYLYCFENNLTFLDLTGFNSLIDFGGDSQSQALTLTGNSGNYKANATFGAGTTFDNSVLSYNNGVLTSTKNTALFSNFTSPTGLEGKVLTGTLTLAYPDEILVTSVVLNHASIGLIVNATEQLIATVNPDDATNKNISWSSSNVNVATVNNDGLVTAVAAGSATITVTTEDGNKTASCTVTVTDNKIESLTQQIALNNGYTWISTNVTNNEISLLNQFKQGIGTKGVSLESRDQYIQAPYWIGTLSAINNSEMYIVNTTSSHILPFTGLPADPSTTPISLSSGWNWIGYIPQKTMSVEAALVNLNPQEGDLIKSYSEYSIYYHNGWMGSLQTMSPGIGYMYLSSSPQTLIYPVANLLLSTSDPEIRNNRLAVEPKWAPDEHHFADNMTITYIVTGNEMEWQSGLLEIGAFHNDECRSSLFLQDFPQITEYPRLGFLVVYGEEGEDIHIRLYDHATHQEYRLKNQLSFSTDAIYGNPPEPYRISIGETGIDPIQVDAVHISMESSGDRLKIDCPWNVVDRLEIIDLSGRILFQKIDFSMETVDLSSFAQGVYLLRLTKSNKMYVQKFVKR